MRMPFPFTAIVGQDDMKMALTLAAVDPKLGGVLAFGDRGAGKSTAVRALAALLPKISVRKDCPYNCDPASPAAGCPSCLAAKRTATALKPTPVVDLPLGATEDRVVGALDLERALVDGEKAFEPGLLARAHRGVLYIDEINLLDDHLVDLLLDVAASGVNVVEREGLSVRHAAQFVLVGSGNPEEGELRPQLLDRFGLAVDVASPRKVAERIEVVRRRQAYESSPEAFVKSWSARDGRLRARIARARTRLAAMHAEDPILEAAALLCMKLGVDGLRGELTLARAANARAALDGRPAATPRDILAMAPMALSHRLRRDPLDEAGSTTRVQRTVSELATELGLDPVEAAA